MRKSLVAIAAAVSAASASAAPPKLLIVISVDQFSGALFDQYRQQFSGGLARLTGGTAFRKGFQSHAATETCPGHSTILTGNRPTRTGIIANSWFDPAAKRADKAVYCAEDERVLGSTSTAYTVSPMHLRSVTLGDVMKRTWPASRTVSIAGKDRAAVMLGGASPDQRWYWDGRKFASDRPAARVPATVAATNIALTKELAQPAEGPEIAPYCATKAQQFPINGGTKAVGNGTLARDAGDNIAFRATPQFDAAVLAVGAGLIRELGLGRGAAPDLLALGLSATDYVGHTYGPGGQEMCLQLMSLDRDLGDFFDLLDRWALDYSVVLTADHGGLDIPERLHAQGIADAAWVDPALAPQAIGTKAAAAIGRTATVIAAGGPSGDIYLDPALSAAERLRATTALAALYRANPQVTAVYTNAELAALPSPAGNFATWSTRDKVRASFDRQRSGDLYIVLNPDIMPIVDPAAYVATHGSPWDYDRRVPILFWRKGMAATSSDDMVETVDIMPTLAAELGIAPGKVDGRCLAAIPGIVCPAR